MRTLTTLLITAACILLSGNIWAQLQVTANNNANALLSSIIGQGVTVSNVTLNCPNGGAGTFTSGANGSNLGISSGMMLTTGSATNAAGPNNQEYVTTNHLRTFSDANLLALEPLARFDPCILEFDIIPTCGTLSINYVFGSDEYMDWVSSGYNDAFGFFITGPNPGGGTYNALNIARIAGPNIPVTIDNINRNTNSAYYVDNGDGTCIGFPPFIPFPVRCTNPFYVQYNGFTVPLTASVAVVPCSTYRMKLAIADAGDGDIDSGVFFAASGVNGGGLFCQGAQNLALTFTTNLTCTAPNSGTATVNPTGGTPPYSYLWSNGQTTQTATGLSAGTYDVTVTDNACSQANTNFSIILATTGPTITFTQTNVGCSGGNNGAATVNITGGTVPYTIAWSNSVATATNPNLVAGTYTVTVTDNIGCLAIGSVTITAPTAVTASATATPSACGAAGTGTVSATPGGGTAPYTYTWSNGPTTQNQSNLAAGNYTVTITDSRGCTATATTTITTPSSFTLNLTSIAGNCSQPNSGSINLTVNGATPPVTYAWSNGAISEDVINLTAGNYTVTVTDGNGCVQIASASVTVPTPTTATIANTAVGCFGGNNGTATVSPTGGVAPYTYLWSNGANTATITNLVTGTYTVTVTSSQGCTLSATTTVNEPTTFAVTVAATNPTCPSLNNGSATATATGGTTAYTYLWSNAATTATASGLVASTVYTVTATDANGCTATASTTLVSPVAVNVAVTVTDEQCNNANSGTATALITNGTAPYTPTWSNGFVGTNPTNLPPGSYMVTVSDANGCTATASGTVNPSTLPTVNITASNPTCNAANNGTIQAVGSFASFTWSHGALTNPATGVGPGTYTVTVADANGCTASASTVITEPAALSLNLAATQLNCNVPNSGAVAATAGGGTAPLTYLWSNATSTPSINNLAPGTYSVTVTDANGCTITATETLATPNPPSLSLNVTPVNCTAPNTAAIDAIVLGGTAPIVYAWSNSANTPSIINISAGNYSVTITDGTGCTATQSTTISAIPVLTITVDTLNPTCFGFNNGSIDVFGLYTNFAWSHGDVNMPSVGLGGGSYTVTVTDNNGCSATRTFNLQEPSALQLSITATAIDCVDPNSGALQANASGGTSPYQYVWSNAATTPTLATLGPGTYTLSLTDAKGCSITATETLVPNPALSIDLGGDRSICPGETVVFNLDTITAPILWHDGSTGNSYTATSQETVSVTVDFANGCQGSDAVNINLYPEVALYAVNDTSLCETEQVQFTIGPAGFVYEWSNGNLGPEILITEPGIYIVTATSNCNVALDSITVEIEKCNCEVFMPNAFSPNGDGVNDVFRGYAECDEIPGYSFEVFDRWGARVFTTTDFNQAWDGTMSEDFCIPGVYIWKLTYVQAINGRNYEQTKKGSVVLLK